MLNSAHTSALLFNGQRPVFLLALAAFLLALAAPQSSRAQLESCARTECRSTHTVGTSNSVAVGVTSTLTSSSSAQGSMHHLTNSSSSVTLGESSSPTANSVFQGIGGSFNGEQWTTTRLDIQIDTSTSSFTGTSGNLTSNKSQTSNTAAPVDASAASTSSSSSDTASRDLDFSDGSSSESTANFVGYGVSAYQDLKFEGVNADTKGTYAETSVQQLLRKEEMYEEVPLLDSNNQPVVENIPIYDGNGDLLYYDIVPVTVKKLIPLDQANPIMEKDYGTASANASLGTSTRVSADITTSNFNNAFLSSF